jgi:hypothetical protein
MWSVEFEPEQVCHPAVTECIPPFSDPGSVPTRQGLMNVSRSASTGLVERMAVVCRNNGDKDEKPEY